MAGLFGGTEGLRLPCEPAHEAGRLIVAGCCRIGVSYRLVSRPLSGIANFVHGFLLLIYGGNFIRARSALNCGSLRIGSSSGSTLSSLSPLTRSRSALLNH
jgi:hypothetical protein